MIRAEGDRGVKEMSDVRRGRWVELWGGRGRKWICLGKEAGSQARV